MKSTAMAISALGVALFALVSFSAPAFAQEDMPLLPIPIDFDQLDLNGTWDFTTSQPTVSGACPAGNAMAGTVAVTQQGNEVTFRYISGVRCNPAGVCAYTGTLTKETYSNPDGDPSVRNEFLVSNTVDVDEEGGTLSSAILLTVYNNEFAEGEGTNNYVHPEGFECRWDMKVVLSRESGKK